MPSNDRSLPRRLFEMPLIVTAIAILGVGGVVAFFLGRKAWAADVVGAAACAAAALIALPAVLPVLVSGVPESLVRRWATIPGGAFHLTLDPLAAFFLLIVLAIPAVVAIFLVGHLAATAPDRSHGPFWLAFTILVAAMMVVVLAANVLLFLIAWEVMSVAAYVLVVFRDERPEVRTAGWRFLAATHLGTACLLPMFLLLARSGSLEFDALSAEELSPALVNTVFLLAVFGFGAKAGIIPFHVWLPASYAAAPGPVPAVLSGVMSKLGLYGLLRILPMLGPTLTWWAWLLVGLGLLSGLLGILNALVQQDLKKLLAYSSVENIGIILLGLGAGLLGLSAQPDKNGVGLEILGFGGSLLHILSHALCKSTLFLGAGAVERLAGHTEIDRLGGLLKAAPIVGTTFLVASAGICGLPPLCGFSSEFLIFLTAFEEEARLSLVAMLPPLMIVGGLALVGGLAGYAFAKAAGLTFLGAARGKEIAPQRFHLTISLPLIALVSGCLLVGIAAPLIISQMAPTIAVMTRLSESAVTTSLPAVTEPLVGVSTASVLLLGLIVLLAIVRKCLLAGREVTSTVTWDCGYARPAGSMQYTGSSFAQPAAAVLGDWAGYSREVPSEMPYFPVELTMQSRAVDPAETIVYRPLFSTVRTALTRCRIIQFGRVHVYVLYIALTLLGLVVWVLGVKG
jgi:formate hydrogenlyase subunit 3/multisubunit Na+/H+ antiporter MnhD subunit